jgi:hypothetical protein
MAETALHMPGRDGEVVVVVLAKPEACRQNIPFSAPVVGNPILPLKSVFPPSREGFFFCSPCKKILYKAFSLLKKRLIQYGAFRLAAASGAHPD